MHECVTIVTLRAVADGQTIDLAQEKARRIAPAGQFVSRPFVPSVVEGSPPPFVPSEVEGFP